MYDYPISTRQTSPHRKDPRPVVRLNTHLHHTDEDIESQLVGWASMTYKESPVSRYSLTRSRSTDKMTRIRHSSSSPVSSVTLPLLPYGGAVEHDTQLLDTVEYTLTVGWYNLVPRYCHLLVPTTLRHRWPVVLSYMRSSPRPKFYYLVLSSNPVPRHPVLHPRKRSHYVGTLKDRRVIWSESLTLHEVVRGHRF